MKPILALIIILLGSASAHCADREEARVRLRDAAYQTVLRHHVTERYRYHVPVSAFAQRRGDEPRAHAKWQPRQDAAPDPVW
jgi:hypothetical protein